MRAVRSLSCENPVTALWRRCTLGASIRADFTSGVEHSGGHTRILPETDDIRQSDRTMRYPKEPCASCPYRRDTPPGIWDASEYEKLRHYVEPFPETGLPILAPFLCHLSPQLKEKAICRGWLAVERDSVAARIALIQQTIPLDEFKGAPHAALYATGAEAAEAGLAGIEEPSDAARRCIHRLLGGRRR